LEIYTDPNNNTAKTFYTHGPGTDEHLALERNGSFFYYHADGLGSITAITDQNEAVVQKYDYDSFGNTSPATGFRNSYAYTGREYDQEAGLYYYRARYYDPMDGRFINKDPIGFRGGINLYAYALNNPIRYRDPKGLNPALLIEAEELLEAEAPEIEAEAEALIEQYGPQVESVLQNAADKGFSSFNKLKDFLGSPGVDRVWHHPVEQCQISKSGFTTEMVNNLKNIISVDSSIHAKISGYYSSIQPAFSNGMRVRDWLAGQSFQFQYNIGLNVLRQYGVIK